MKQIPIFSDAFDYCKPPFGRIKAERLYLFSLFLLLGASFPLVALDKITKQISKQKNK